MRLISAQERYYLSIDGVLKPDTVKWYKRKIDHLVDTLGGDVEVAEITTHDLNCWRGELVSRKMRWENCERAAAAGGLSVSTIRGYVRAARTFFNFLVEEGYLDRSPAKNLRMPPKKRKGKKGIADADREAMLNAVRDDPRDYAVLMFTWETACRRAGVAGLTLTDLELERRTAHVFEKGDKGREVYFTPKGKVALERYLETRESGEDEVWLGKEGPLTVWGIYDIFKDAAEKAGVKKKWSPHQWRHARARYWLQRGMSLAHVSQLLGHTDVQVTVEFYGQFTNGDLKEMFDRYSDDSPD